MVSNKKIQRYYQEQSPEALKTEEIDGTFFPKEIPVPEIVFIPHAEPQVIITDWYENPQDWYYIPELIKEFTDQSYVAYYRGLYFASYMLSTSCLELILKYELIRNRIIDSSELEKSHCNFSWAIKKIQQIGLENYKLRFEIVLNMRNGIFHFNPKRINESLRAIQKDTVSPNIDVLIGMAGCPDKPGKCIRKKSGDFPWLISEYVDNYDWSKIACSTYVLLFDVSKQLYG